MSTAHPGGDAADLADGTPVSHLEPPIGEGPIERLCKWASEAALITMLVVIGVDIFNEPWDYTWAEWKTLAEHAFQAINSVNPNTLVFVEGVSGTAGNQDGTPVGLEGSRELLAAGLGGVAPHGSRLPGS